MAFEPGLSLLAQVANGRTDRARERVAQAEGIATFSDRFLRSLESSADQGLRAESSSPESAGRARSHESSDRQTRDFALDQSVALFVASELRALEEDLGNACRFVSPGSEAASHLVAAPGKRVRPLTAWLVALVCNNDLALHHSLRQGTRAVALTTELVHSATLLHDDVIDEGNERRGRVASRRKFGNGVSVLAGDLLLTRALEETVINVPMGLTDLLDTVRQMVESEIVQMLGRTQLDLRIETQEQIMAGKTGALFAWCCRNTARICAPDLEAVHVAFGLYGHHLGCAFQIVDDILDYSSSATGKSLLADLHEGKLTLPLLLAIEKSPELIPMLEELRSSTGSHVMARALAAKVRESGALILARDRARKETQTAQSQLGLVRHALGDREGGSSLAAGWLQEVGVTLLSRLA